MEREPCIPRWPRLVDEGEIVAIAILESQASNCNHHSRALPENACERSFSLPCQPVDAPALWDHTIVRHRSTTKTRQYFRISLMMDCEQCRGNQPGTPGNKRETRSGGNTAYRQRVQCTYVYTRPSQLILLVRLGSDGCDSPTGADIHLIALLGATY